MGVTTRKEASMTTEAASRSTNMILEPERLSRVVSGKCLVDNISIQIKRGIILAIVGPSGAGKSSFLRLINRLDEPTSGTVWLEGVDYRTLPPQELRRRVGMVMQSPYLFSGTIAENVRFGPRQRGEELPQETIDRLLRRVGLAGYAQRDVGNLSGGEAQRVSLARTLANSPEILLLDEPTSALDDATQRGVEDLILGIIREQGLTCLIVTHDMEQARRMATHVMLLESGKLAGFGPAEEVLDA
jgi:putative ABC transport system ATP-binding protein